MCKNSYALPITHYVSSHVSRILERVTELGIHVPAVEAERAKLAVLVANITRPRIFIGVLVEQILDTQTDAETGGLPSKWFPGRKGSCRCTFHHPQNRTSHRNNCPDPTRSTGSLWIVLL